MCSCLFVYFDLVSCKQGDVCCGTSCRWYPRFNFEGEFIEGILVHHQGLVQQELSDLRPRPTDVKLMNVLIVCFISHLSTLMTLCLFYRTKTNIALHTLSRHQPMTE